jgi:hypothetical protein
MKSITVVTSDIQGKISLLKSQGYTLVAIADYFRKQEVEIQWLSLVKAYKLGG